MKKERGMADGQRQGRAMAAGAGSAGGLEARGVSSNGDGHAPSLSAASSKASKKSQAQSSSASGGKLIERHFTRAGKDPLDEVVWERRTSVITNPDGSTVFKLEGAEIPAHFSQLATDIVVSKYFRKAGLFGDKQKGERSVREVVFRLAHTIREAGERLGGYFADKAEADAFEAELSYMLVHQIGAFNSPVWFNCGLFHRYQIAGSGGNWAWNEETQDVFETQNAYERPQCSACFIQSVSDDLMSIYDLVKSEARLFKYGSGTGSNFSALRGKQEKLSGGGTSSGLMSFLEVLDRAAGATKSAAPPVARPRWSASTWTTPRSWTSSSGRSARRRRRRRSSRRLPRRLQRRGLPHRLRPELQQLGPRDRRVHEAGRRRRHLDHPLPHHR